MTPIGQEAQVDAERPPKESRFDQRLFHCNVLLREPLKTDRLTDVIDQQCPRLRDFSEEPIVQNVFAHIAERTSSMPPMPEVRNYDHRKTRHLRSRAGAETPHQSYPVAIVLYRWKLGRTLGLPFYHGVRPGSSRGQRPDRAAAHGRNTETRALSTDCRFGSP